MSAISRNLPSDLCIKIFDFVGSQYAHQLLLVSKVWKSAFLGSHLRRQMLEDKSSLYLGYPKKFVSLFRKCGQSLWELPILDLRGQINRTRYVLPPYPEEGTTNYIDFIQISEMTYPVMRFTSSEGCVGLAFRIQQIATKKEAILTLFQIYPKKGYWARAWENNGAGKAIEADYGKQHSFDDHRFCYYSLSHKILTKLLKNEDPFLKLVPTGLKKRAQSHLPEKLLGNVVSIPLESHATIDASDVASRKLFRRRCFLGVVIIGIVAGIILSRYSSSISRRFGLHKV